MTDRTDARIRSLFGELARATPPAPPFGNVAAPPPTRRPPGLAPRLLVGYAAAAAVVAALVVVRVQDDPAPSQVATAGQTQTSAPGTSTPGAIGANQSLDALVISGSDVVRVHSTAACSEAATEGLCVSAGGPLRQAPVVQVRTQGVIAVRFEGGTTPSEVTASAVATGVVGRPQPRTLSIQLGDPASVTVALAPGEYHLIMFASWPQATGQYLVQLQVVP